MPTIAFSVTLQEYEELRNNLYEPDTICNDYNKIDTV